jgi:23S rRNA (cytosine1962-C5)-methyltransferase
MKTVSVDLSSKYLEWGKRNFALNQLPLEGHSFYCGDAFDELKRMGRRGNKFDVIVLDPPTFSQSKRSGPFRVEKDYGKLVDFSMPLLKSRGILYASTNAANWHVEAFLEEIDSAAQRSGRRIVQSHFAPQPPDFPISRAEPAYLKTIWLRIA